MIQTLIDFKDGLQTAFLPVHLLYSFAGVFLGTFIGVLPGIGPLAALSILIPLTYSLGPTAALVFLGGIYYGTQYGGAITAILLNMPGLASHAVTCLDGYPLAQQGKAGTALLLAMLSSFSGAIIGILMIMFFSPAIAGLALEFGPAEYSAIMLLGLVAAATLVRGSVLKGGASVVIGLLLGTIGMDIYTALPRLTFGIVELQGGISIAVVAMGLFGITEVMRSLHRPTTPMVATKNLISRASLRNSLRDIRQNVKPIARGAGIGAFFGTMPGTGSTLAAFISYTLEKKISRRPETFGKGAMAGISGPEASTNAAAQTAFIPTLVLGIPGDAAMALMLGALILHGIEPGPLMMVEHKDVFWGLIASFWIGNILLLFLNVPLVGMWVRVLSIPYRIIAPIILVFICLGVYAVNNQFFDISMVLVFGILGVVLSRLGFGLAPLLLGFVLSSLFELNFRRALLMSGGDFSIFVDSTISILFVVLSLAIIVFSAVTHLRPGKSAEIE